MRLGWDYQWGLGWDWDWSRAEEVKAKANSVAMAAERQTWGRALGLWPATLEVCVDILLAVELSSLNCESASKIVYLK